MDENSVISELSTRRLLQERDDAISSLVKQAMEQDQMITKLQSQIEILERNNNNNEKSSLNTIHQPEMTNVNIMVQTDMSHKRDDNETEALVQQLQKEAEVFASQVIELDGEIEQLRTVIEKHERHISALENQLQSTTTSKCRSIGDDHGTDSKSNKVLKLQILDLEAEIDELKEANITQRNELRDIRRKLWETDTASDEIVTARNETIELKAVVEQQLEQINQLNIEKQAIIDELNTERTSKSELVQQLRNEIRNLQKSHNEQIVSLEKKLDESRWLYDEIQASPSHMSKDDVIALRDEIEVLRQNHTSQNEELRTAKATIQELEEMIADQSARDSANFEEEKEELFAEIESLTQRLNDANEKIKVLEADVEIINDFKDKLERADEAREASEKNIIDTFERRISLLTLDKDITIDKLRKELVIEKESTAEEMDGLATQLKSYQVQISELQEEMTEQIEQREARIYALEATLTAQEQLVNNMRTEMDHLQNSMENSVARRKDENDEMQQELLVMTATAAKHEREITSLKVEMDAKVMEYQSTITKLEQKIVLLEKSPIELRNAQDLQMELRVKEVKDRLEKLKWRNTSLKEENINLRERLEKADALAKANNDNERLKELEELLAKHMLNVKSLESELNKYREPPQISTDPITQNKSISGSSSPTSPIIETDEAASSVTSKEQIDSTSTGAMITEKVIDSPSRPPRQTDRKISAPSPPRRGLKIFGRK
jgi:chromosome segregation ATPase